MLDKQQKLEISPAELAVIEAALHTQSKILHVQASAGGTAARTRLNEVKRVLARIAQQTPAPQAPCRTRAFGWFSKRMPG
tara:strand:+ start:52094 stop:52333 length:240 start_codon:yes stop_codon:yes gene_type:complete